MAARQASDASSVNGDDNSNNYDNPIRKTFDESSQEIQDVIADFAVLETDDEAYNRCLAYLRNVRENPAENFNTALVPLVPEVIKSKKPFVAYIFLEVFTEAFLGNQAVRNKFNHKDHHEKVIDCFGISGVVHEFGTVRHASLRALFHLCQHCPAADQRRMVLISAYNKIALLINEAPKKMLDELQSPIGAHQASLIHPEGAEKPEQAIKFIPRWTCRLNELAALVINVFAHAWADKPFAKKAQLLAIADRLLPNLLVPLTAGKLPVPYPETRLFQAICETLEILVSHPLDRVGFVVVAKNRDDVRTRRSKEVESLTKMLASLTEAGNTEAAAECSEHLRKAQEPVNFGDLNTCKAIFEDERQLVLTYYIRMAERVGIRISPESPYYNLPGVKRMIQPEYQMTGLSKLVWCLYRTFSMCQNFIKDVELHRDAFSQESLSRFAVTKPISDDIWWRSYTTTLNATVRSIISICERLSNPAAQGAFEGQVDAKNWLKYVEIMLGELHQLALPHLEKPDGNATDGGASSSEWPSQEDLEEATIPAASSFLMEGVARGIRVDGQQRIYATSFAGCALDSALLAMNKLGVSGLQWDEEKWGQPKALASWTHFWKRGGLNDVYIVRERRDDPRVALDCHPWMYVKRSKTAKEVAARFFKAGDFQTAIGFYLRGADLAEAGRNPSVMIELTEEERDAQSKAEAKMGDIAVKEQRIVMQLRAQREEEAEFTTTFLKARIEPRIQAWKEEREALEARKDEEEDFESKLEELDAREPADEPSQEDIEAIKESADFLAFTNKREEMVKDLQALQEEKNVQQEELREFAIQIADRGRAMRYGELPEPEYQKGPLRSAMLIEARDLLVLNLTNASECALRMDDQFLAAALAIQALHVDPRHTKSISRMLRSYDACPAGEEKDILKSYAESNLDSDLVRQLGAPKVVEDVEKPMSFGLKAVLFGLGALVLAATGNAAVKAVSARMDAALKKDFVDKDKVYYDPNAEDNEPHPSVVDLSDDINEKKDEL